MRALFVLCLCLSLSAAPATARVITVSGSGGGNHLTIQAGINAASTGDTVLVAEGDYAEWINFSGKNIVVASHFIRTGVYEDIEMTVIDGSDSLAVVTFENQETRDAKLIGFTITGGGESGIVIDGGVSEPIHPTIAFCIIDMNYSDTRGGGVYSDWGSPRFENCWITNNEAKDGGGVYIDDESYHPYYPEFYNCLISDNYAFDGAGGGAYCSGCDVRFVNCVISGNSAENDAKGDGDGGGIYIYDAFWSTYSRLENCVIAGNDAEQGGGIYVGGADSGPRLRNCIVWGNWAEPGEGADIYLTSSPYMLISYCDVHSDSIHQNDYLTWEGVNKAVNPLFVGLGDYHLQAVSPCRDSGNPDPSYNDPAHPCRPSLAKPPALAGLRNDMGAYGGAGADDWYDMKLLVTPEALDFGEIPVEEESTMNITVANLGIYTGFDLEICSVISSEPEFEIDLMDTLVEAEDEEYVDVTFEAADTGWVSGTITVWTADGSRVLPVQARGVIPVAVAGAGLPPIPFRLEPNAPNPFNPYTSLRFSLPEPAEVLLRVHDVAGRAVATLARGAYDAGEFQAVWNGRSDGGREVPPGIYFAHLTAGEKKAVRKMLLVK